MIPLRDLWPKRFRIRFYNRLMLYNTLIFVAVACLFAIIASRYSQQLDTIKQLQQSRDALNAVYNYYDNKQNDFVNLVFPLYDSSGTYNTLSDMLESVSDDSYENDPFAKQKVVQMMEQVAVRDRDIAAILIRKNRTGSAFLYTPRNRLLQRVEMQYPFLKEISQKSPGRSTFGTRILTNGSLSQQAYGISGTLGTNGVLQQAGQFLFAYDTHAIERVFQGYRNQAQGRFVIVTADGEVVFDSNLDDRNRYGEGVRFPHMEWLKEGVESAFIDGTDYYVQTVRHASRKYVAANLIPKSEIRKNSAPTRIWIYTLFTAMAFICAVLYSIAGKFVSRRVNELIKGMKRVGSNNLGYRIPQSGRNDEFEEIASRFNLMVNELQTTINREYVNEIRKKNAELKALQAGINPHFLYNTLEAIRIKAADDGSAEVSEMIVMLANLYRSVVRHHTFIEIRKELQLCSMYLNIFSLRYASQLDFEIKVDPAVLDFGIPKNLLQPIIENYFVHGIRLDGESNKFAIRGYLEDGDIMFLFDDNGRGINKNRLEQIRSRLDQEDNSSGPHYGLSNVQERIQLVYGDSYGLRLESEEGSRTHVYVRIKAQTAEELDHRLEVRG